ncbi:MAG: metallophosphoesterase [Deltaproteobacteria bacterium]|nr:metallophosphoesterase [Deltaproteobacteria bacterium]
MTDRTDPSSRYLVVSDLHLCDFEEHADGWKVHKSARFSIDEDFEALVDEFVQRAEPDAPLVLVLNGDIFDFDLVTAIPEPAPWPVSSSERKRGLLPTADKSVWKLRRMLSDHSRFLRTLAGLLVRGHKVVYVMGNHDREFHFTQVQDALVEELRNNVAALGGQLADGLVQFEPWFYYVPGVIYAEHGQQYDFYSSFRYVLSPVVEADGQRVLALAMGNLSNRYLVGRMGYFNPHASDYILNVFHYVAHWLRFYAFSRHGILINWFWGSILVIARLAALKKATHRRPDDYDVLLDEAGRRAGLMPATIQALGELQRPPITTRFFRILREFWIDRLTIAVLMTIGTVALAVTPVPLWVKLMVPLSSFPLLYFVYESLARGETIFTAEHEVPKYAAKICGLLSAKVITFGHTHRPRVVPLARNRSFVDTGTWAPITQGDRTPSLVPGYRNYLVIVAKGDDVRFTLGSWMPARSLERPAVTLPERVPATLRRGVREIGASPSRA